MSTMERILRLLSEKKASDIYLSAHSLALIKINGLRSSIPMSGTTRRMGASIGSTTLLMLRRIG